MSTNKSNWLLERQGIQYSIRLLDGSNKIGRKPTSEIIITDSSYISRDHCEINICRDHIQLVDYSTNGTFVNEKKIQFESKILKENDKIGIGVNDVDDKEIMHTEYHVYILQKINNPLQSVTHNTPKRVIMCPAIIDLVDSDSDGEELVQNEPITYTNNSISRCESNTVKNISNPENNLIDGNTNEQDTKNKVRIISDVVISKPHSSLNDLNEIFDESSKLLQINPTDNKGNVEFVNKSVLKSQLDIIEKKSEQIIPNKKPILTIDIVSDDEENSSNSAEAIKENTNNSIVFEISDDEDFQCSQFLIQDIKEEINEFDLEINNKNSPKQNYDNDHDKNEKLSSPVYDLLNEDSDDEEVEEFDETLANWYIKLSQGLAVKKELKEEEEEMFYSENNNIIEEENVKVNDIPQLELNKLEEINVKDIKKHLPQNENKNYPKIEKSKIVPLIDAPSLPVHKGKLRGVSAAERKTKLFENIKLSVIAKDKKLHREKDLKEKWLSKPNKVKEREKIKKNHDDRKEKLKLIADKETQKRKISEPTDTRSYKKPKVKITNSNRGAFLTEIPTHIKNSSKLVTPKRKNSEIVDKMKSNKIAKTTVQTSQATTEIKSNFQPVKEDLHHSSKNPQPHCSTMETRPQKLTFKSLELVDNIEKRPEKIRRIDDIKRPQNNLEKRPEKSRENSLEKRPEKSRENSLEKRPEKSRENSLEKRPKKSRENNLEKRPEKSRENKLEKRPEKLRENSLEKRPENLRENHLEKRPDATISKIPTIKKSQSVKSILVTKSKSEQQRIVKKVRFIEKPKITYYDIEMTDVDDEAIKMPKKIIQKDLNLDMSLLSERKKLRLLTNSLIDHTDSILSQILLWKPDWLESGSEDVNGSNHRLTPMIHQFQSLTEYENIVFPFLKLETWMQLRNSFKTGRANKYVTFTINGITINDKCTNKRIIYNCQYSSNKNETQNIFLPGDIILFQINLFKYFGYVRENNLISNNNNIQSYCSVTFESKISDELLPAVHLIKSFKVKKLSSITIELGQFNAVSRLKCSPLLKYVLSPINLPKRNSTSIKNIKYKGFNQLNEIQNDVLLRTYLKCINPKEPNITLIEGPPGTGKSRLITNLALQILYGGEVRNLDRRILICAPSNAAVDVITLQLIHIRKKMTKGRFNLVRFGVIDRMHPEARMFSLTGLIGYNRKTERNHIISLETEKKFIEDKIKIITQNNHQNTVDQNELFTLKQNLNRVNSLINPEITNSSSDKILYPKFLAGAHIICTTLPSCVRLLKYMKFFDICIIDEATQCSEPWSLIPFQFTINSLVLVGDKQQLPPIVLSKLTKEYNYGTSLFTRISECLEHNVINNPILSLRTQYRMHPEICRWPNTYFYKNKLINNSNVMQFKTKVKPYLIFNLDYNQNKSSEIGNISNTLEASFIIKLIKHLKDIMPFALYKYGIITPYAQHRDMLQKHLKESKIIDVVASTVDSYQGKEKDIIIISNGRTEGVGFLYEPARLNVSLTRAKICLILCGNFSNIKHVPVWTSLLNDAKNRNLYYNITSNDIVNFKDNVMKKMVI